MNKRDDHDVVRSGEPAADRSDPFATAIRGTRMPMVLTDPHRHDNPIVFASEAFYGLTGYSPDEVIGFNCRFLQGPDSAPEASARIHTALAAREPVSLDILNYRKDGTTFWNALYITPVWAEDGTLEFFFASQLDVSDRIEAQREIVSQKAVVEELVRARTEDLESALAAKTTLLDELDHRVKNNLTMVGALLRLQARSVADPALRRTLDTMLQRVDALATVHRRLYQSGDVVRFDIGTFTAELASDVLNASGRQDIRLVSDVAVIMIPVAQASATGLIINEIITNAIRHGFAGGRGGHLTVSARRSGDEVTIELADDGGGFDVALPVAGTIGRALIDRLSRQIGGVTEWRSGPAGTHVTLRFPVEDAA